MFSKGRDGVVSFNVVHGPRRLFDISHLSISPLLPVKTKESSLVPEHKIFIGVIVPSLGASATFTCKLSVIGEQPGITISTEYEA